MVSIAPDFPIENSSREPRGIKQALGGVVQEYPLVDDRPTASGSVVGPSVLKARGGLPGPNFAWSKIPG